MSTLLLHPPPSPGVRGDLTVHLEVASRLAARPASFGSAACVEVFVGTLRRAMATSTIDLEGVTAVIEYEYEGATRFLTKPDPENVPIRFSLQVEAACALFDMLIPIRYKDKTSSKTMNIRISPLSITSLEHSTRTDLPDAVKPILPTAMCLELQLAESITILVPSFIKEPVAAARLRSGKILDSFGSGAKITILPPPLLPSYDKVATVQTSAPLYTVSATFDLPDTRSRKRKQSQEVLADANAIWNKLQKLEAIINHRPAPDIQACDQSLLVQELRAEVADLRKQLTSCQKKCADLEIEVAGLREAQANVDDGEGVELAEMREDIKTLESRIDYVERGKDDEELGNKIKVDIFEELAARVMGG
ncbi:hypothetical protein FDENT_9335 [Fusarium denticulatum]|uniref:Uncharacterized protein n=1 Tax=Fusarium denticulatum TaxID=48507 RepID=A0A8H5X0P9_9HYPO|nr:hypothetical protein FDENT_9335 [Fusarium denticulatum]